MNRGKWIALVCVATALAGAAALPYLFPLSSFIPDIELAIAQRVHQPVSIKKLQAFILPLPHLRASAVTIGRNGLLDVDSITIYPNAISLFDDTKVIREIEVRGVRARFELLGAARSLLTTEIPQRKRAGGEGRAPIRVDRITLRDVSLRFPTFSLPAFSADIRLQNGKPAEIRASQQRDRLQLTARRQGENWNVDFHAHDWTLPVGIALQFDFLEGTASVTPSGIESHELSGALYGGTFSGPVSVGWKSGWSVAGQLHIEGVDLERVVTLIKREVAVSGKLSAAPSFSSQARDPVELLNALEVESDFAIERGVLYKVDLIAAAKNPLNRAAAKGGKTEFDELKGHLLLDHRVYEFSDLQIASGLFKAKGEVTVNRDKALSGRVRAELRGTASLVSMPLDVSGTTEDPSVFPTRGALAGALAGTMLMPGIGTAVGMKAGEFTERLFGRKKPERRKEPAQK